MPVNAAAAPAPGSTIIGGSSGGASAGSIAGGPQDIDPNDVGGNLHQEADGLVADQKEIGALSQQAGQPDLSADGSQRISDPDLAAKIDNFTKAAAAQGPANSADALAGKGGDAVAGADLTAMGQPIVAALQHADSTPEGVLAAAKGARDLGNQAPSVVSKAGTMKTAAEWALDNKVDPAQMQGMVKQVDAAFGGIKHDVSDDVRVLAMSGASDGSGRPTALLDKVEASIAQQAQQPGGAQLSAKDATMNAAMGSFNPGETQHMTDEQASIAKQLPGASKMNQQSAAMLDSSMATKQDQMQGTHHDSADAATKAAGQLATAMGPDPANQDTALEVATDLGTSGDVNKLTADPAKAAKAIADAQNATITGPGNQQVQLKGEMGLNVAEQAITSGKSVGDVVKDLNTAASSGASAAGPGADPGAGGGTGATTQAAPAAAAPLNT